MTEPKLGNGNGAGVANDAAGEEGRARGLAARYRCPFIDLKEQPIDHELLRSIPVELMFRYHFVPLGSHNQTLEIAIAGYHHHIQLLPGHLDSQAHGERPSVDAVEPVGLRPLQQVD